MANDWPRPARRRWLLLVVASAVMISPLGLVPAHAAGHPAISRAGRDASAPEGLSLPLVADGRRTWFLVGTGAVDIMPTTPVTMAAYGTYRVSTGSQPGHPLMARSIAISSADGSMAHTVVLTELDLQGYFIAYKEDPLGQPGYFGTDGIRAQVQQDTGLDPEHVIVGTTHTHDSPDTIGIWGGGDDPRNEAYLAVVRAGAIKSIEEALSSRRRATLVVGRADGRLYQDTVGQVRGNPATYPMDRMVRVLQARDQEGRVVATLVNYAVHPTVVGQITTLTPDWPGEVAQDLDARYGAGTTIVAPGALGRTWPTMPPPPAGSTWQTVLADYAQLVVGRVDAALNRVRPVIDPTVAAVGARWVQPITNPVMLPLFYTKTAVPGVVGGLMRSDLPPYSLGAAVTTDLNAFRVGDLFLGGAPGEAYPEIQAELQARVTPPGGDVCGDPMHVFALSLTNDQIGYTPTLDEYAVALDYTGDEGIFTLNPNIGDDNINAQLANARRLGFSTGPDYNGATAGPVLPPPNQDTPAPPYQDQAGPAPQCPPGSDPGEGSDR